MSEEVEQIFSAARCRGRLCVQLDDHEHEVALGADEPVVAASVIKVLVALAAESAFDQGALEPTRRVRLTSTSRTPGPTGFSLFRDAVEVSARDLVTSMLTISDNVATDALLGLVGLDTCNELADRLGLGSTVIVSDLADMITGIARDAGFPSWDEFTDWQAGMASAVERTAVDHRVRTSHALTASSATRTTARDMCRMLRLIWTDEAGPPNACGRVRAAMARQLTRNRLAAGFPPPARVAAKSGGLLGVVRNEVGVVLRPDGSHVFAAVFTEAAAEAEEAAVNAAIGAAAATAARQLRR